MSEVAGCNRRSFLRYAAVSTADATGGVHVVVVKIEHPEAVTNTRGSGPG